MNKFKKTLEKVKRGPASMKKYEAVTGTKYEPKEEEFSEEEMKEAKRAEALTGVKFGMQSKENKLKAMLDEAESENEKLRIRQRAKSLGIKLD